MMLIVMRVVLEALAAVVIGMAFMFHYGLTPTEQGAIMVVAMMVLDWFVSGLIALWEIMTEPFEAGDDATSEG